MVISKGHWLSKNCLRIRFHFKPKKCRSFCLSRSFFFASKMLSRILNSNVRSAVMWVSVRARAAPAAMCRTAVTAVWCAHRERESRAAARTICPAGTGWNASIRLEKDCPKACVSAGTAVKCAAVTGTRTVTSASWRPWAGKRCSRVCPRSPTCTKDPVKAIKVSDLCIARGITLYIKKKIVLIYAWVYVPTNVKWKIQSSCKAVQLKLIHCWLSDDNHSVSVAKLIIKHIQFRYNSK